jgi:hypothetical protein
MAVIGRQKSSWYLASNTATKASDLATATKANAPLDRVTADIAQHGDGQPPGLLVGEHQCEREIVPRGDAGALAIRDGTWPATRSFIAGPPPREST